MCFTACQNEANASTHCINGPQRTGVKDFQDEELKKTLTNDFKSLTGVYENEGLTACENI